LLFVKPIYPLNHAAETQSALVEFGRVVQWINGFDNNSRWLGNGPVSRMENWFESILTFLGIQTHGAGEYSEWRIGLSQF
jgi:hypothetical protein